MLTHGIIKKSQKTPKKEIERAENYRLDYLRRKKMSGLEKYIDKREKNSPGFKKELNEEYENLRIGLMIKELRLKKGITQEELAKKLHTTKSAISRLENHAESIRLATLEKVAKVLGKEVRISFV